MHKSSIQVSASGTSAWLRLNSFSGGNIASLGVIISDTATVDVEFALEEDLTSPNAFQHDILNTLTVSTGSSHPYPVTAVRLNVTSYTSGTITLLTLQGN